jgi:hypothetical protein
MLIAAQTYLWLKGQSAVHCAKMHHQNNKRCIFCQSRQASQPVARQATGPRLELVAQS